MTHTPGPWIDSPNASDAIISTDPDAMADAGMEVKYYGGLVICESVYPKNKPLIRAAPEMFAALEAHAEWKDHTDKCARCGLGLSCLDYPGLARKADELTRAALAKAQEGDGR